MQLKSAFKGYAKSYGIEKYHDDPLAQLQGSRFTIKKIFEKLLTEMRGFKYQITLVVRLSKEKDGRTEYVTLYFNSLTKIDKNDDFKDGSGISFKEIINRIQNWVKEGSGWVVESVAGEYVNIAKYSPLNSRSYIELPKALSMQKKV